jgi:hypothetical protein
MDIFAATEGKPPSQAQEERHGFYSYIMELWLLFVIVVARHSIYFLKHFSAGFFIQNQGRGEDKE